MRSAPGAPATWGPTPPCGRAASTGTPSSAARAARARPTRSARCSSGSSSRPTCGWRSSTPTPTSCNPAAPSRRRRGRRPLASAERDVRVLRSDLTRTEGADKLRLRFRSMPCAAQAAVLRGHRPDPRPGRVQRVHPHARPTGSTDLGPLMENLRVGTEADRRLAHCVENLGLAEREVWARDLPSAADIVTGSQGVTVMDLGGFGDPLEPVSALEVVEEPVGPARPPGADAARHRRGAQPLPRRPRQPRRRACSSTGSSRSRPRAASTACGCCCPRSGPRRSTRRSSASATT